MLYICDCLTVVEAGGQLNTCVSMLKHKNQLTYLLQKPRQVICVLLSKIVHIRTECTYEQNIRKMRNHSFDNLSDIL